MNERDFTLLDNYFNGLLAPDDARALQARAATDPAFGEEFSLREKMEAFPRQEAERDVMIGLLKSVGKDYFKDQIAETPQFTVVRNNVRRWIALAASVILVAAAVWFFNQPSGSSSGGTPTYQQYAQHTPLSLTVMGNTEQAKTDAETAFGQKDYAGALSALEQVLAAEPSNIKASLYRGICLLELGRFSVARATFEPMAAGSSALREEAAWYIALSYLKETNVLACKAALARIAPGEAHYAQAQEILEGLE
ncbi:MAG: tetratricopeptide repeat protein [Saprospiraceae bacterium]